MNEVIALVKALTVLAVQATSYLTVQNGGTPVTAGEIAGASAKPPRITRTRAPKAQPTEVTPPPPAAVNPLAPTVLPPVATPPPAAVAPQMTEAQSNKEAIRVATNYVTKYKGQTPDGQVRAQTILVEKCNVQQMRDLDHANRLVFIAALNADANTPAVATSL